MKMRVIRAEQSSTFFEEGRRGVKEGYIGAFWSTCIPPIIFNNTPSPSDDFEDKWFQLLREGIADEYFFAFPPNTFFRHICEFPKLEQWNKKVVFVEYEVEAELISQWQVIFHQDTARLINEIPATELLS